MAAAKKHRFEDFADFDIDGAAVQVGLQHFPIGQSGPFIRINTGAIELVISAHETDIDNLIDGLKAARRAMRKAEAR